MSDLQRPAKRPWWRRLNDSFNSYAVPDPWLRRKFVVLIVFALSVWCLYVAIGRTCVPAIQRHPKAGFSRGAGIGLLVACLLLWLMFMWSYVMIISVGPGFAKDVVPETPDPRWRYGNDYAAPFPPDMNDHAPVPPPTAYVPEGHDLPDFLGGGAREPFDFGGNALPEFLGGGVSRPTQLSQGSDLRSGTASVPQSRPSADHDFSFSEGPSHAAAMLPTSDAPPRRSLQSSLSSTHRSPPSSMIPVAKVSRIPRPVPGVSMTPRWCEHCKIVKPDRTHHCRHCGTCILQFDHHCLWIGQCVGWRNHAIFVTFCLWAGAFCGFNTAILVTDSVLASEIDGQKVALIVISSIFFLFTLLLMLPTHIYLILTGKSTLESFQTSTQREAEEAALKLAFNNPACPTREIRAVRKEWVAEYGGVAVNDRWAVGPLSDRWKREMGNDWLGWLLPIGRPLGDGVHYEQNPRFGPHGEWLPMREWPKELVRA